jgi:hypothetical protein
MATITFSISSTPVTGSRAFTISDADVTRLLTAMRSFYDKPEQSNAQILNTWAVDAAAYLRRMVKDYEAKANSPSDIGLS